MLRLLGALAAGNGVVSRRPRARLPGKLWDASSEGQHPGGEGLCAQEGSAGEGMEVWTRGEERGSNTDLLAGGGLSWKESRRPLVSWGRGWRWDSIVLRAGMSLGRGPQP